MATSTARPDDGPPEGGLAAGPVSRRSDRSPWNWLLVLPVVLPLLVPLFNKHSPELFGWPFFYWFQLALIPVAVVCTSLVYWATKRPPVADRAARHDGGR